MHEVGIRRAVRKEVVSFSEGCCGLKPATDKQPTLAAITKAQWGGMLSSCWMDWMSIVKPAQCPPCDNHPAAQARHLFPLSGLKGNWENGLSDMLLCSPSCLPPSHLLGTGEWHSYESSRCR